MKTINKINSLLTKKERLHLILISLMIIIGMCLEIIGIGSLLPLLEYISNIESKEIDIVSKYLGFNLQDVPESDIIKYFLLFIVFVYLIKSVFLSFLSYIQNRFLQNLNASISSNLFNTYLDQSYLFHVERNSSDLSKHIISDVSYFISYSTSIMILVSEISLLFAVILSTLLIEPFGTTVITLFLTFISGVFFLITRTALKKWGKNRELYERNLTKVLFEGLRGIKDLMIFKREGYYKNEFEREKKNITKIVSNFNTINQLPRYFLEFVSILGLVLFIVLMTNRGDNIRSLIPTLGIFVAATFRSIPSVNKILASFQNLKYFSKSVDVLIKQFHLEQKPQKQELISDIHFKKNILIKNLSFKYPGTNKNVLSELNLKIEKGQTIGIVGESGSGKSTLIDLIVGLHKPSNGQILVDNRDLNYSNSTWLNQIGYVPQNVFLSDTTIKENIAFAVEDHLIESDKILNAIRLSQLDNFIKSLPLGVNTRVGESGVQLSGGQRQRIGIARAMYSDPKILVFDEATSSLDDKTEKGIMESIYNLKNDKTIIIISHRITTLDRCDKIYSIKKGMISENI